MALDKSGVTRETERYASLVATAKQACDDAAAALTNAQTEIGDDWKGDAASELVTQLEALRLDIEALSNHMENVKTNIRNRCSNVCSNWTEKK